MTTVIDALKPGEMGRLYHVATFDDGKRVSAYTLWYNREWDGCIMFDVIASNGRVAHKAAKDARRAMRPEEVA